MRNPEGGLSSQDRFFLRLASERGDSRDLLAQRCADGLQRTGSWVERLWACTYLAYSGGRFVVFPDCKEQLRGVVGDVVDYPDVRSMLLAGDDPSIAFKRYYTLDVRDGVILIQPDKLATAHPELRASLRAWVDGHVDGALQR
jgi:hypothetical protein